MCIETFNTIIYIFYLLDVVEELKYHSEQFKKIFINFTIDYILFSFLNFLKSLKNSHLAMKFGNRIRSINTKFCD